eukprot:1267862-Pleurochrysis_carterae.AAC.2
MTTYCYMRMCALALSCVRASGTHLRDIFESSVLTATVVCKECSRLYAVLMRAHVAHLKTCPQRTRLFAETCSVHVSASKPHTSACQSIDCRHGPRTNSCMFITVSGTVRACRYALDGKSRATGLQKSR